MSKANSVYTHRPSVLAGKKSLFELFRRDWQLILLALPGIAYYLLFRYGPMYGLVISFQDYGLFSGIGNSPWVGLKHFQEFFSSGDFWLLFNNTLILGLLSLFLDFPVPIVFAILLNEIKNQKYKKFIQTSTYLPTLLSVVVVCSMVIDMLSPSSGIFNYLLKNMGLQPIYFMIKPEWYRFIYVGSDVWQYFGYSAIIYIAALANIDAQLYEAATIDGCGRFKSMLYVTLPGLLPTIATMFILRSGNIMRIGFEKALLLYNPATYSVADIFSTYTYRKGIIEMNYSYSAAVGMFESLVALILIITTNTINKKLNDTSIW